MSREHGTPQQKAAAIGTAEIRRLVAVCGDALARLRDRAMILLSSDFGEQAAGDIWNPATSLAAH